MLKAAAKKLILLFTAALFCLAASAAAGVSSFAANGVEMRLEKLKKDFPHGWYYNHKVSTDADMRVNLLEERNEAYAKSVSRYPCVDHGGEAEKGAYDCNFFDGGYQCHGFAAMLFYEIFGVRQSESEKDEEAPFNIKLGDLVRLNGDTHSAIVITVKGDSFTVAEANAGINGQNESCRISWGKSYSLSDITYCVRADNYKKVSADTDWKNTEDKADVGTDFYAAVYNGERALTLTGKATLSFKAYTGSASQVWNFTRQKNGSYKIVSCKNGRALAAVKNGDGTFKVTAAAAEASKGQLWAFYEEGGKYFLSAESSSGVLAAGSDGSAGIGEKASSSKKTFTLKKKKAPVASEIKAKGANGSVSLSWSKGKYTKSFDLELYSASSKLYKKYEKLTSTSLKVKLPAGNYSAKIISKNAYSEKEGNTVYFTVGKKGVLGKTAKVTAKAAKTTVSLSWTPVPDADGYAVFLKKNNSWKRLGTTKKTSYTAEKLTSGKRYTFAIRAYKLKNGKVSLANSYTSFTAATKARAPSKLSATQTASTVKLSWSGVKNADGYRAYRKTSSGWTQVATTTAKAVTVKGLTSGKKYTFGVRAFIKTDTGTVWSDIISLTTATAPKAPEVTVSGVKNLKATIRWDKVSGADGYQVYYKAGKSDSYTLLANYKATDGGVSLSGLTKGEQYVFAVRAYKKAGGKVIYGDYKKVKITAVK